MKVKELVISLLNTGMRNDVTLKNGRDIQLGFDCDGNVFISDKSIPLNKKSNITQRYLFMKVLDKYKDDHNAIISETCGRSDAEQKAKDKTSIKDNSNGYGSQRNSDAISGGIE